MYSSDRAFLNSSQDSRRMYMWAFVALIMLGLIGFILRPPSKEKTVAEPPPISLPHVAVKTGTFPLRSCVPIPVLDPTDGSKKWGYLLTMKIDGKIVEVPAYSNQVHQTKKLKKHQIQISKVETKGSRIGVGKAVMNLPGFKIDFVRRPTHEWGVPM